LNNNDIYDIINDVELKESAITKSELLFLTGYDFNIEDIRKNPDEYNSRFYHLYTSYGFTNMYDFITYADSNTEVVLKGGDKDLSNLNKVKRKVMRNGKMIDMTIYEDSNKEDTQPQDKKPQEDNKSAVGSTYEDNGDLDIKPNLKRLAGTLSKLRNAGSLIPSSVNDSDMYKEFHSDGGSLLGMMAVSIVDDKVVLDGYISTPDSSGVGLRSILETIRIGIKKDMAIKIYDIQLKEAIEYLNALGFKKVADGYVLDRKSVRNFLGEHSDFI